MRFTHFAQASKCLKITVQNPIVKYMCGNLTIYYYRKVGRGRRPPHRTVVEFDFCKSGLKVSGGACFGVHFHQPGLPSPRHWWFNFVLQARVCAVRCFSWVLGFVFLIPVPIPPLVTLCSATHCALLYFCE